MPRGGKRAKAGRRSQWHHPKTTTIRIPENIADQLLEIAKHLDQGGEIEFVTESKKGLQETQTSASWLTTREAWEELDHPKPWNTFRRMRPERLLDEFGLLCDESRKVKGKTDSRWLRFVQQP